MGRDEFAEGRGEGAAGRAWRVSRINIRSRLSAPVRYVARVELLHDDRGPVSSMGVANDTLGAVFGAAEKILGCTASIINLYSYQRTFPQEDNYGVVIATIVVDRDGARWRGTASGDDLLHACLAAFIEAISTSQEDDGSEPVAALNVGGDLLATRPC